MLATVHSFCEHGATKAVVCRIATFMTSHRLLLQRALRIVAVLLLAITTVSPVLAQTSFPAMVSSRGYINGTALTAHTTAAFNSVGASTLVAFVSTNTPWNGQPVSISGLSDNVGNTWNVLTGPTTWVGSQFPLLSAIYYVNAPVTSSTHTLTVNLTNAAPLVVHVLAASGSDITGPPIYSAITDPAVGGVSADVTTAPISVPANTLLLGWAKNETSANATALDGYSLDGQSTSFLWAESKTALTAGSYIGHFAYDAAIGWATAIVGLKPAAGPVAFNQTVTTNFNTPVGITLTAQSPSGSPLIYSVQSEPTHGALSGIAPNLTYTPNTAYAGSDAFTFKVNDGTADSNIATVSITVRGPNHPPVASDGSVTVAVGSPAPITLSASDVDNDPLTYSIVNPPAHGQLSSGTSANRTYTPNAGYIGPDSFTFKANDGMADSNVATVSVTVTAVLQVPAMVSSRGYINGTALTAHTTAAFNSVGASTLVAFVSTNTPWNGQPVSISGLSDNVGNTWNVLTGPTTWVGSQFPLLSAIYYVNAPVTSSTHTLTVNLTNAAPLVVHVLAASGSDITGPPIYSAITDPAVGGVSADVTTAPISVPANTLLLGWAKNETSANATALDGYSLDGQSTSFLWAESKTALTAGSYIGHFAYDAAIGWATAIVGLKPAAGPVAFNQTVTTNFNTPVGITLTAQSPSGSPLIYSVQSEPTHGALSGIAPNLTYTPNTAYAGSDAFTFKVNDGTADSNIATVSITVRGPNHPPVASDGSVTVAVGSPAPITLSASDVDNDPLTYSIVNPPAHGQLSSGTSANRTYTPNAGYIGPDSFTFKANDGMADSNVATVSVTVTAVLQVPAMVSSRGYINGTALTAHTTAAFNSVGASTLVAFVSTHSPWNGQPVSISGLSDNVGNTWNVLTGPTTWVGSQFPLLSAIYYVNAPVTSSTHTLTVNLTNAAPLVVHVLAASGSDITGPPIYSAITDPAVGGVSADVTTAPISVPANTLLLGWAKNETSANATALDGYSLDGQSTSFLWAESKTALTAGSYIGHFAYDAAIGWATAIVGLKPAAGPVAFNQTVTTNFNTPVGITLTAQSPSGSPLIYSVQSEPTHGALSGIAPNLTYTPNTAYAGSDAFTFKVNDGTADSNIATVTVTITPDTTAPPTPAITSTPGNPTNQTSASFSFTDTEAGVSFLCQLDGIGFSNCSSPATYPGPLTQGNHTFSVKAQDAAANQGTPASFAWTVDTTAPPVPALTSTPANPTNQTSASFSFTDTEAGVSFLCQLDGIGFSNCSSPATYPGPLTQGNHTFSVKAQDAAGNQGTPASFAWTVDTTAPPVPALTSTPANPTNQTSASFTFTDTQGGVSFLCQFDGGTFSACTSPKTYSGLTQGNHTFSVKAQDAAGNQSAATSFTWTVDTTAPPVPTLTSTPANPTNQTSASFTFTDTQGGVSFLCQRDGSTFSACTSPKTYSGLTQGNHTFSVKAQDAAGNQSAATSFTWTVDTTAPPVPALTSTPANPTNQTSASFTFTDTQGGVSFLCQFDGGTFSACTSPKTYSGLTQGNHTFSVKAQDAAGNQSAATSFTWTVDTTAPPVPALTSTPANPTNQTSASFSFTDSQGGVSFLCQFDGGTFSACTSPKTYSGLSQGSHTFSVKAQDAAGNQSAATSFTWTVDTTAPPVPALTSTPANPTNQTSASFSFTDSQGGVSFLCQRDGSTFSACTSPKTYSGLTQGSHTFSVKAQDAAGNQSAATSFTWTVDTTAPPVPALTSTPANPTNQTSASFSFTDSQGGVSFLCQRDGSTFSACTSPKTYSGLTQGSHTFSVKAQDAAGNQSAATSFTWTVDTTAPPVPALTSTPANPTNQTSASFSFTDSQGGVSFLCQRDGSTFSACTSPKTYSGLTQGSHTFSVKAQDAAGNQSAATSFTWTVDTTAPPVPALTSTPANPTNQTSASFSFTDSQGGVSFLCQRDGSTFSACTSPKTYSGLTQGNHTFSVKAQDAAGNQSAATSFTWTVDTTAPPVPALTLTPANPTNQTSASFSFTDSQGGVSFLCQRDGSTFSACTSPKIYLGLSQGSHTFSVKAQDAAGNQSGAANFNWTITR